ncbi:NADH-quinone oxidoreductase subunit J [Ferroplasma sp.]|uniref:NADH-quinone oxidoreductase subunit J n=1 Tax=Ferroplasma sp. TaxID=2591003 RepID=UPI00307E5E15
MIYTIIFLILAAIGVIMALSAISSKNLIHSSIFLLMLMVVFSSIFIFLGLSFVGSVELLVYTGSIVILIVFVLMLTGGKDVEE